MSRHRFMPTKTRGVYRCACGVQCMVVVRMNGCVATMRAINLYRHPMLTTATRSPNGLLRAKGWTHWSTMQPAHVTRQQRARGQK